MMNENAQKDDITITPEERILLLHKPLQDWLNKPLKLIIGINADANSTPIFKDTTIIEEITRLSTINGFSFNVEQWNVMIKQDIQNPYGDYGLDLKAAMQLMNYINVVVGASIALNHNDNAKWFKVNLWDRVEEIYENDHRKFIEEIINDVNHPLGHLLPKSS